MAPHSSTLAWKIPWTEEPGRLQSMGLRRVRHDCATSLSLFTFMHWRRKWKPTRVLAWRIPGMGKPGGLPSLGLHRAGHNWSDLAAAAAKRKGIPDHLTCLLRNLCVDQESTVRTRHGTNHCFKSGKGVWQACILSLCLFNLHAEYIIQNARLDELHAGIKIAGRNTTSDMQMTPPLWKKVKNN